MPPFARKQTSNAAILSSNCFFSSYNLYACLPSFQMIHIFVLGDSTYSLFVDDFFSHPPTHFTASLLQHFLYVYLVKTRI